MLASTLFVAALCASVNASPLHAAEHLQIGEFFKPPAEESSGVVGTSATYSRSPCPALNSLANHGYLPRDGRNITRSGLKSAIMDIFNMANDSATTQVGQVPEEFNLDYLSTHNFIEHDASLVRADVYFGFDPMTVDPSLAEDFLARGSDKINTTAVAHTRRDRATLCQEKNPECTFGASQKQTAFLQAALLLLALGEGDAISVDHAKSFFVYERIPTDFVKSANPVTVAMLTAKYLELVSQAV